LTSDYKIISFQMPILGFIAVKRMKKIGYL